MHPSRLILGLSPCWGGEGGYHAPPADRKPEGTDQAHRWRATSESHVEGEAYLHLPFSPRPASPLPPAVWRLQSASLPPPCCSSHSQGGHIRSRTGDRAGRPGTQESPRVPCTHTQGASDYRPASHPPRAGESLSCRQLSRNVRHGCLCQASFTQAHSSPRDEFLKQTAFTYVSRQSHVSIRDPQTET